MIIIFLVYVVVNILRPLYPIDVPLP